MEIKAFTSGANLSKVMANFLDLKANFKLKTVWIVDQFLALKQVDFALLTDSSLYHWKTLIFTANAANIKQLSGPENRSFEKQAPGDHFINSRNIFSWL